MDDTNREKRLEELRAIVKTAREKADKLYTRTDDRWAHMIYYHGDELKELRELEKQSAACSL